MSGCARASTCAFRSRGKTAYLFGDLGASDLDDLVNISRHHAAARDGTFPDARILDALRHRAIGRIPG